MMKKPHDYKKSLKQLKKYYIRRKLTRTFTGQFPLPIKQQILLTSSMLRMQVLGEEFLMITNQNQFLSAMGTLRMMFEELIALTFVLEKLSSPLSIKQKEKVLDKAIVGIKSGKKVQVTPFNILTMGNGAEKYLEKTYPQLAGMYNEMYEFISEYVHPNGPARFHFWTNDAVAIYFKIPPMTLDDTNLLFNHGCLALDMYHLVHKTLKGLRPS